jgi:hypothetical protein
MDGDIFTRTGVNCKKAAALLHASSLSARGMSDLQAPQMFNRRNFRDCKIAR